MTVSSRGLQHGSRSPPDEAERERIRTDLDSTLFVEAGAGAGKTSSLVARIVNLVRSGVPITGIAAITFTEKAAAELRTRTRQRLEADPGPETDAALARLDHAPIGTLHSFARRILFDFPIEAGLPPGFTVLDELESGLAFEEQWNDLLDVLLDDPEPAAGLIAGGRAFVELCEFDGFGVDKGARRMADDFRSNWDLVHDRVELSDPGPARSRPLRDRAARRPDRGDADPPRRHAGRDRRRARRTRLGSAQPEPAHTARSRLGARRQVRALGHRTQELPGRQGEVDECLRHRRRGRARSAPGRRDRTRAARSPGLGERQAPPTAAARRHHRPLRARRGDRTGRIGPARVPRPARARPAAAHRARAHPPAPARPIRTGAARRVPGHRPDPARDRRPPHLRSRRPGSDRLVRPHRTVVVARPPARSPAASSSSAIPSSRSTGSGGPTSRSICAPPSRSAPTTCGCRPTSARPEP